MQLGREAGPFAGELNIAGIVCCLLAWAFPISYEPPSTPLTEAFASLMEFSLARRLVATMPIGMRVS